MVRFVCLACAAAIAMLARPVIADCPEAPEEPQIDLAGEGATPHRIRAGAEILALVGVNAAWYWLDNTRGERNPNWELRWDTPSWRKKLLTLEAVVFDTNGFGTDFLEHPVAGAMYYQIARGNDLSLPESFLFAAAGSAIWEYVPEFPEKVSLNDLIVTPAAGLAVGEAAARLGAFLERGSSGPARALGSLLFLPRRLNDRIDRRVRPRATSVDALGLPADVWHRFELGASADVAGDRAGEGLRLHATTELLEWPARAGPARPGAALVLPGSTTAISFQAGWAAARLSDVRFVARTGLGGIGWQDGGGATEAQRVLLQGSTAYEYALRDYPGGFEDRLGIVHVGPALSATLRAGPARLRAVAEGYGDFAGVQAVALDRYLDGRSPRGLKTLLGTEGYYFAIGATARAAIEVAAGGVEVGAEVQRDWFESIEGRDRLQDQVTRDVHLQDRRAQERVWLSYVPPGSNFRLTPISVERVERTGRIGRTRAQTSETRILAGVAARF